ncbi:hypothetical protein OsJ_14867 [Oryza sativa Japonica Group]|uniref:Uncharacterized protein n=1 Tax=Oryza sativa subsp. japonica TaxID=39947 RepID=B9FF96_ORYSJ|nr:hypothetical protein OsJ_14867 [Oryza sativa Japonica Group]
MTKPRNRHHPYPKALLRKKKAGNKEGEDGMELQELRPDQDQVGAGGRRAIAITRIPRRSCAKAGSRSSR